VRDGGEVGQFAGVEEEVGGVGVGVSRSGGVGSEVVAAGVAVPALVEGFTVGAFESVDGDRGGPSGKRPLLVAHVVVGGDGHLEALRPVPGRLFGEFFAGLDGVGSGGGGEGPAGAFGSLVAVPQLA
jgi:hypothetical protein